MRSFLKSTAAKFACAALLGAALFTGADPAEARGWDHGGGYHHGGYGHRGGSSFNLVLGGGGYYGGGYRPRRPYYYRPAYYAPPPAYYAPAYYAPPPAYYGGGPTFVYRSR